MLKRKQLLKARFEAFIFLALVALLALTLGSVEARAAEAPKTLWQTCEEGSGAGECGRGVIGVATDPLTGNVFVVDNENNRINVFGPWGEFLEAWGWGVFDGSSEFQTCGPSADPPAPDCRAGLHGVGVGEFATPTGVTVDSSGDVYVLDVRSCVSGGNCGPSDRANRVQKFDSDGDFILMFGREVNLTKVGEREAQETAGEPVTVTAQEENVCTAASGDVCGRGVEGTEDGAFGAGALSVYEPRGGLIAVGPGDVIHVGGQERIQRFTSDGAFLSKVTIPGEQVFALDVDSGGNLFVGFAESGEFEPAKVKGEIQKLGPGGEKQCTATLPRLLPTEWGLALTAAADGHFYVAFGNAQANGAVQQIRRFSPSCADEPASAFPVPGMGAFRYITGIATSSACGLGEESLYVNTNIPFTRAYFPSPDPNLCPPPAVAPIITAQYAASVASSSAEVRANINSHFWPDTTYHLQWGEGDCKTDPAGCQNTELLPGAQLGSENDVPTPTAGVVLTGLKPDTTYHFRFIAKSSGGGPVFGVGAEERDATFHTYPQPLPHKSCPNQAFRTGSQAALPDCRAYEMVSPIAKQGGDVIALLEVNGLPATVQQATPGGERLTYSAFRAFADPRSSPYTSQYLATRGPQGWVTEAISPYQEGPRQTGGAALGELETSYQAFTEDLCSGWIFRVYEPALDSAAIRGYPNLYKRSNCGSGAGSYEVMTRLTPQYEKAPGQFEPLLPENFIPSISGFSANGEHTVFYARGQLGDQGSPCAAGSNCPSQLFDYHDGIARQVCVEPNGTRIEGGCSLGSGSAAGGLRSASVDQAVSADGSRIFWTKEGVGGKGQLYARINGSETLTLSAAPARFWTAAADGSRVIFSVPDPQEAVEGPLYAYDVESQGKVRIAKDATGFMGASDDASIVYFTSPEVLPGVEPNNVGAEAEAGEQNLYVYDVTAETYAFVAILSPDDVEYLDPFVGGGPRAITTEPRFRTARVSKSGLHAAFASYAPLTGADNTDFNSGRPDSEAFLFDVNANRLRCVSCHPGGARPVGRPVDVGGGSFYWVASSIPTWPNQAYQSRVLSDSGDRLFFESAGALVLHDTNGKKDVYEWEVGESQRECEAVGAELFLAREGGCLSLISSGENPSDSEFIDASASGSDVFFSTSSSLLPQDPGQRDIYIARAGGGFPPPPSQPAACEGEACQGPFSPPNDPTPASTTFQGAGNVVEKKQKKKQRKKSAKKRGKKDKQKRAARNRGGNR